MVGISGIDTRALTRHLRERGSMRAGIFSGEAIVGEAELLARVQAQPQMKGAEPLRGGGDQGGVRRSGDR